VAPYVYVGQQDVRRCYIRPPQQTSCALFSASSRRFCPNNACPKKRCPSRSCRRPHRSPQHSFRFGKGPADRKAEPSKLRLRITAPLRSIDLCQSLLCIIPAAQLRLAKPIW